MMCTKPNKQLAIGVTTHNMPHYSIRPSPSNATYHDDADAGWVGGCSKESQTFIGHQISQAQSDHPPSAVRLTCSLSANSHTGPWARRKPNGETANGETAYVIN
eukprot:sb/3478163/